jgi:hypothetical protein
MRQRESTLSRDHRPTAGAGGEQSRCHLHPASDLTTEAAANSPRPSPVVDETELI